MKARLWKLHPMSHAIQSRGFTLIEVLVSLVILAIGLLGLAVMQVAAMQNTQGSSLRAQAVLMAYDIVDRMRANIVGANNGDYDIGVDDAAPAAPVCLGVAADCDTAQLGQFDLAQWRTSLNAYLPSGTGSIETVDIGDTTLVTINVRWLDPYSAEAGAELLTISAELPQ